MAIVVERFISPCSLDFMIEGSLRLGILLRPRPLWGSLGSRVCAGLRILGISTFEVKAVHVDVFYDPTPQQTLLNSY